jgi:tellurite resistance protein TerC
MFETIGTPSLWAGFVAFVLVMLAVDLGVFHRKAHEVGLREALIWSGVWITLAMVFNLGVWHWFGQERGLEFLTGYLIEKALAVDNIFVFIVIFGAFGIPAVQQHRVLVWGVLGALVMRAFFIFAGAALLHRFHWMMYVFGALLIVTGIKLFVRPQGHDDPENNWIVRLLRRAIPSIPQLRGSAFFVHEGRWLATPLFLTLIAVEVSDLIFAVDSIPAIFAVTTDPFIVFTSNIFAILGLRSLFFVLAGMMVRFRYLDVALAFILVFVGAKMAFVDVYKLPIHFSLAVIATSLAAAVIASLRVARSQTGGLCLPPAAPASCEAVVRPREEG